MSKVIAPRHRRLTLSLMAALVVDLGTACTTTSGAPAQSYLSGRWQLDKSASEDPDSKISAAVADAESKLRRRLANAGYTEYGPVNTPGGGRGARGGASAGAELNGDEFSATGYIGPDFAGLRRNLKSVLGAPQLLVIDVQPEFVRLAGDEAPPRDYPYDEEFTRIDEYGTARIDTSWSGTTFKMRARYSTKAVVTESYTADPHSGQTLTVTRSLSDPIAGKLVVRSVYRH
jgi:hypothetical protein